MHSSLLSRVLYASRVLFGWRNKEESQLTMLDQVPEFACFSRRKTSILGKTVINALDSGNPKDKRIERGRRWDNDNDKDARKDADV